MYRRRDGVSFYSLEGLVRVLAPHNFVNSSVLINTLRAHQDLNV